MGITTLSVDDETKDRFDDARPDGCRSAGEFVNLLLDVWEDTPQTTPENSTGAPLTVDGEFVGTIESMETSVETVEERTGRIERQLEELQR